ncbi:MAG TPA: hypothetical protein VFS68_06885 [Candidatus Udaeobacter sp.]|nr:hypothetical protein [Candidatus Udaeobacter sp.]
MKVRELITQLLDEDMDYDIFIRVGKDYVEVDGISNQSVGGGIVDVLIEPDRELKDAAD